MSGFGPELANHARLRRQPGARGYRVGAYARNSENNENAGRQAASKVTLRPSAESTELRLDKRGLPSRENSRYKLSRFSLLNSAARATPPCASTMSRRPTRKTSGPSSSQAVRYS